MKKLIEVEIYGQTFTVTSEDEETYVQSLAAYVDRFMRQVGGSTKATVPLRVAIMAALGIADDYHKALSREEENRQETEYVAAKILMRLEEGERAAGVHDTNRANGIVSPHSPAASPSVDDKKKESLFPS
ncbi:MAG: cell division protein ZapA [Deltaproteobacteria bacterium]|nr:cell division protein ZapA [Deltaproteobacteria bacterium]